MPVLAPPASRLRAFLRPAPVLAALAAVLAAGLPSGCSRPRPLVLLVTVDTLRADHLGAWGDGSGATPNLDRLAAQSIVFERAYAPSATTVPCLSSLMASRYPEELGVGGNRDVLAEAPPLLAEWLRDRGWATAAVVSNGVLTPEAGLARGFQRYNAQFTSREAKRPLPERPGPDTTAAALSMLDRLRARNERPVFLWIHYQDPHGPYTPPPAERARFLPREQGRADGRTELPVSEQPWGQGTIPRYQFLEERHDVAFYRAGYRGEVAFMDAAVGALLKGLADRGLADQAVIVFAADHGENLGEEGYWFAHGTPLHESLVHVPLMIHDPGRTPGRRTEVASLLDVFPTLAHRLGGTPPPDLRGRDLLAAGAEGRPSTVYLATLRAGPVPHRGLITRGLRYVVAETRQGPRETLYRLGSEGPDLGAEQPAALEQARRELALARASLRTIPAQRQHLGPEDEEGLRALGYVDGR